jgi:hypothetical protein
MFTLNDVVPWGRSLNEYRRMFALSEEDLGRRILGCADGPASFNAEATALGGTVVSIDPLYAFSAEDIRRRIDQTFTAVMEQTRQNAAEFVWNEEIPNIDVLGQLRMAAMQRFLDDYEQGKASGRYVEARLPVLTFEDDSFDVAVCSHFLFLYSEQLSEDFHVRSLRELCRVSPDVRVFPLLELGSIPSRHVPVVASRLRDEGHAVRIEPVNYEFQRGGNQMMRIRR